MNEAADFMLCVFRYTCVSGGAVYTHALVCVPGPEDNLGFDPQALSMLLSFFFIETGILTGLELAKYGRLGES